MSNLIISLLKVPAPTVWSLPQVAPFIYSRVLISAFLQILSLFTDSMTLKMVWLSGGATLSSNLWKSVPDLKVNVHNDVFPNKTNKRGGVNKTRLQFSKGGH